MSPAQTQGLSATGESVVDSSTTCLPHIKPIKPILSVRFFVLPLFKSTKERMNSCPGPAPAAPFSSCMLESSIVSLCRYTILVCIYRPSRPIRPFPALPTHLPPYFWLRGGLAWCRDVRADRRGHRIHLAVDGECCAAGELMKIFCNVDDERKNFPQALVGLYRPPVFRPAPRPRPRPLAQTCCCFANERTLF